MTTTETPENGRNYHLINKGTNTALTAADGRNVTAEARREGGTDEKWIFEKRDDTWVIHRAESYWYLFVGGQHPAAGGDVGCLPNRGGPQTWNVRPAEEGAVRICCHGTDLALDFKGEATAGTPITVQDVSDAATQCWVLEEA